MECEQQEEFTQIREQITQSVINQCNIFNHINFMDNIMDNSTN